MTDALYCVCASEPQASAILTHLRNDGFGFGISVFFQNRKDTRDISLIENALRSAGLGGIAGALISMSIPGIGSALALGQVLAVFNGTMAGAVIGGLIGGSGALRPRGLPADLVDRLQQQDKDGNILIGVHTQDPISLAKALSIFKSEKADDLYASRQERNSFSAWTD